MPAITQVLRAEESEDRVGDYLICRICGGDDPDFKYGQPSLS